MTTSEWLRTLVPLVADLPQDIAEAERYRTLPAPAASSPTIPVPRPTLAEEVAGFDGQCAEIVRSIRATAVRLRDLVDSSGVALSPSDRDALDFFLARAREKGRNHDLELALITLRPYLSREGA